MQTVLIVIHFLVVIALVGVVLLQPSEGGGFGGGSSFMSTRGTKSALTRLTTILAICFFAISIGLIVVGNLSNSGSDILNRIPVSSGKNSTKENASESMPLSGSEDQPSIIDQLGGVPASSQQQNDLVAPTNENPLPPLVGDPISNSKSE
ncbi:Preprotein translocase, SecG subunit [Bartonella clarridgeiae 73]|uniref:Protein-export membrane protein SecG n=1 Tax=Bartonella clarridgeiae (strain CCUG 45776 / CIP 104772 / 73) TaxID=696125 RepID=E6YHD0_BARC7|nr:preprotein translocase subunit SecG [Bartonella clarridgeiae]WCR55154.1 MAG: Protein translocase membrane subunit SecG [Bartonella clarridgeiae]CBI76268.1 Preprotein translocase, SecG subunit [Bartonella clarridgeiae 73]